MRVLFVAADSPEEWSTSEWLCKIPSAALNRSGRVTSRVVYRDEFLKNPVDPNWDIIIFERLLVPPFTEKIKKCQAAGIRVLARFDDNYALIPAYVASSMLWRRSTVLGKKDGQLVGYKMQESMLKQFREGLGVCDAVSTPSRLLCQDYERYAKKIFYVPNYADLGNPAWTAPKPKHEGIIIGWGGGGTHKQSVRDSSILPALEIICRRYPEVKLMICGNEQWVKEELVKRVSEDQLIFKDWVPNEEWPLTVAHFDIGLAPLAGSYDDRRSWVKVLDYALLGVPYICSSRPPYRGTQGGIHITNKRKNWVKAIASLIERKGTREKLANIGKVWGRRKGISQNVPKYLNMFEKVLKG